MKNGSYFLNHDTLIQTLLALLKMEKIPEVHNHFFFNLCCFYFYYPYVQGIFLYLTCIVRRGNYGTVKMMG